MTSDGYEVFEDPYLYPGTTVLRNKLGLMTEVELESFELEITTLNASEPAPEGKLDASHYKAIHHHLFSDVYDWAGQYRTVRIAKGGNPFCYPENIAGEMDRQFSRLKGGEWLKVDNFEIFNDRICDFLAELNAIHPFREGNGRCQLSFLSILSQDAGFDLDLSRVTRSSFLPAMIQSFHLNLEPLKSQIRLLRV